MIATWNLQSILEEWCFGVSTFVAWSGIAVGALSASIYFGRLVHRQWRWRDRVGAQRRSHWRLFFFSAATLIFAAVAAVYVLMILDAPQTCRRL